MKSANEDVFLNRLQNPDPKRQVWIFYHWESCRLVCLSVLTMRMHCHHHRCRRLKAVSANLFPILAHAVHHPAYRESDAENRHEIEVHHSHRHHRRRPKVEISDLLLYRACRDGHSECGAALRNRRHHHHRRRPKAVISNVSACRLIPVRPHAWMICRA